MFRMIMQSDDNEYEDNDNNDNDDENEIDLCGTRIVIKSGMVHLRALSSLRYYAT